MPEEGDPGDMTVILTKAEAVRGELHDRGKVWLAHSLCPVDATTCHHPTAEVPCVPISSTPEEEAAPPWVSVGTDPITGHPTYRPVSDPTGLPASSARLWQQA